MHSFPSLRALKNRHWDKIFKALGKHIEMDENFTLQTLLDLHVVSHKDLIVNTSTEATQEGALEELLGKVQAKWTDIEFTVLPYKDSKDVFILGAIDEIQARGFHGSSAQALQLKQWQLFMLDSSNVGSLVSKAQQSNVLLLCILLTAYHAYPANASRRSPWRTRW